MKTRLIIVRHAEAEGNINRVFHGWTDGEITEKGHLQAIKLAERLKGEKIDVLYSSSLKRTMQTAGYISSAKGLAIIRTDKLKEINGGDWEGEKWAELPVKWPREYETWEMKPHIHKMPNGETMEEFRKRLIEEVEYIINQNRGKTVCIVTHGTAIKALQCFFHSCRLEDMSSIPWQENTAITIVDYENGRFSIATEGDVSHLDNGLKTIEAQDWWIKEYKNIKGKESSERGYIKSMETSRLVKWLFETDAIKVCENNKPFWYTSGTIGPYYINTHFLYGNGQKAAALLKTIDDEMRDTLACPPKILALVRENYASSPIYKGVIDSICAYIKENIDIENVDFISGGERRDWFFSILAASFLNIPHLSVYKSHEIVMLENGRTSRIEDLSGCRVLHVADLITEASSYQRAWIPAIRKTGGDIKWSVAVVDRLQGGGEYLKSQGIESFSMLKVDKSLFDEALRLDIINREQHRMLLDYLKNPNESMRKFLKEHPEFLENSLKSDGKTAERARLCIENNVYGL